MTHTVKEQGRRRGLRGTIVAVAVAGSLLAAGCSSSSKAAGPPTTGATSGGSALTSQAPKAKAKKKPKQPTDTGSLGSDAGSSIDTGGFDSDTGGIGSDADGGGGEGQLGPIHFTPPEGYSVDTSAGGSGTSYANADGDEITVPSCDDSASSTASDAAATCAQSLGQLSNTKGPVTGSAGGRDEALVIGTAQPSGGAAIPLNFAVDCYQASNGFECATLLTTPDVDITTVLTPFVDAVEQSFGS